MNPFLVLAVPPGASDAEVRAAYQALLRRFPPEHRPRQFQLIQEAYQALRTERDRWHWRWLHLESGHDGPLEAVENFAHLPGRFRPPGAPAFRGFLRACAAAAQRDQAAAQQSTCPPAKR
ncbi:MAG: J domain-containing protein [Verrucomicrobia bacterium]|nr:J domain-containing protein [Verrucomicrobiota bacterium]